MPGADTLAGAAAAARSRVLAAPPRVPRMPLYLRGSYSELSKYVQNPGKAHMDAAHHVLRYLRGTYDQAIVYERIDVLANTLWGWVDSDWAADLDSRRSHTGYILMLSGGAVSWKSRRQDCVSL